jgi:hypothetical protein
VETDPKNQLSGKRSVIMAETVSYSCDEHGHTNATEKLDTESPVRRKIDFLLGLSVGSAAFGILLLALILVYLLHGLSAEALAIWICCSVVAPALVLLGGGLFWFTKEIPRDRPGKRLVT